MYWSDGHGLHIVFTDKRHVGVIYRDRSWLFLNGRFDTFDEFIHITRGGVMINKLIQFFIFNTLTRRKPIEFEIRRFEFLNQ